jgi:hypothetical protein
MTTAFELGCLSAMEKVAAEPNTASNYGNALQAAQKKINIIGNNPNTKAYDAPYWNSFGSNLYESAVRRPSSFLHDSIFGSVEQQRAAQTAAQDLKDKNLMLARHKKDYGQAGEGRLPPKPQPAGGKYQSFAGLNPEAEAAARAALAANAPKGIPSHDGMATGLNPTIESKKDPAAPKNYKELAPNAALLKNPYVLGGLGAAGLGLGGYAAYRAYQNSKKKKRPM